MIPTMVLLILIYAYIFSGVRTGSEQVIYGCRGGGMQALVCSQVAAITCFYPDQGDFWTGPNRPFKRRTSKPPFFVEYS